MTSALTAQQSYQQAPLSLVLAQANRFSDTAALCKRSVEAGGTATLFASSNLPNFALDRLSRRLLRRA
jgi:hypothetical protein